MHNKYRRFDLDRAPQLLQFPLSRYLLLVMTMAVLTGSPLYSVAALSKQGRIIGCAPLWAAGGNVAFSAPGRTLLTQSPHNQIRVSTISYALDYILENLGV